MKKIKLIISVILGDGYFSLELNLPRAKEYHKLAARVVSSGNICFYAPEMDLLLGTPVS